MSNLLVIGVNPAFQCTLFFKEVSLGSINRAEKRSWSVGGKGQNVAIALSQLSKTCSLVQLLGGDTGQLIKQALPKSITQYNIFVGQRTRTCTTLCDSFSNTTTELIEPSGIVTQREYTQLESLVSELIKTQKAIAICGTIPCGINEDFYNSIVRNAPKDAIILMDAYTNVSEALKMGKVTILKINRSEAEKLAHESSELKIIVSTLYLKINVEFLIVTDGKDGAVLESKEDVFEFYIDKFEVCASDSEKQLGKISLGTLASPFGSSQFTFNPLGAGDTCSGILLATFLETNDIVESVKKGLAAATASCLVTNSTGHFELKTMEEMYSKIIVLNQKKSAQGTEDNTSNGDKQM